MVKHFCNHCGKEINIMGAKNKVPIEKTYFYWTDDGVGELNLCNECSTEYWEHRRDYDMNFFGFGDKDDTRI